MISLRKLAQLAGVSHMTVHRALQGQGRISAATRARILALAAEHGYLSEPAAPTAPPACVPTIACIFPASGFFNQLSLQFVQLAYTHGYEVLQLETPPDDAPMAPLITRLIQARVSAAFLFSPDYRPISRALIYELRSRDILPFMIGRPAPLLIDTVKTDETALATLVVNYLLSLGHAQIAYVGYGWAERSSAFAAELQRRGFSRAHCQLPPVLQQRLDRTWHLPDDALEVVLSRQPAPTAIFAFNDHVAAEVLQQCYARGIQVPRDLSLIGCANTELARYLSPRLTTVDQQITTGVQRIWQQFLWRKAHCDEDPSAPPQLLLHPSRLIMGDSCRTLTG
jgi:DNA-binding LacI/PurR family transcriptional regulator